MIRSSCYRALGRPFVSSHELLFDSVQHFTSQGAVWYSKAIGQPGGAEYLPESQPWVSALAPQNSNTTPVEIVAFERSLLRDLMSHPHLNTTVAGPTARYIRKQLINKSPILTFEWLITRITLAIHLVLIIFSTAANISRQ